MNIRMISSSIVRIVVAVTALAAVLTMMGCAPKANVSRPTAGGAPGAGGPTKPGGPVPAGMGAGMDMTISVQAATVSAGKLLSEQKTTGTVNPVMKSNVVGQTSGVVARVLHKAGDWIKEGEIVIQLDDNQLKLSLKAAQASLEAARISLTMAKDSTSQANPKLAFQVSSAESALASAKKTYDSQKAQYDLGGVTGSDLDKAKSNLDAAEANVEAAKSALDQNQKADVQNNAQLQIAVDQAEIQVQQALYNVQHAAIDAPYAGLLVDVNVMPGESVSQNTVAFTIASQERKVDFAIPPADAGSLPVGSKVQFELKGKSHSLTISQSGEIPISGVVPLVAAVPGSLPLAFGSIGTVSYPLLLATGTLIPGSSVQSSQDTNFVYVVDGDKAIVRQVTLLAESGDTAAVSGLEPGAKIVLNPPPGLLDGSAVKIVAASSVQAGSASNGMQAAQEGQK